MAKPVPSGCGQGRWPERNSATHEDSGGDEARLSSGRRVGRIIGALLVLSGWPATIALVAACYGFAQYLPVFIR